MDCNISRVLRAHQMQMLTHKYIWEKVFMTMEVTACKDFKK